jgi:predicted permease
MGVPLVVALLGPRAAGPAILLVLLDMVFTSSLCIALSRLDGDGGSNASAGQAAKNALKGVAANPMPWSILMGAAASALQIELPKPLAQTIGLLADAASPVALFTIGAVLARSQILTQTGEAHPVHWLEVVPIAAIKLFLHPALVSLVGASAIYIGVPLDRFALTVLVLLAALPSASNVSLLAERFGADNGRIARIILVSTAAAFFTFSGAVALMTR